MKSNKNKYTVIVIKPLISINQLKNTFQMMLNQHTQTNTNRLVKQNPL